MAKDDNTFTPVTFVRTRPDGTDQELVANSRADAVRLKFEGWTEKPASRAKPAARPGSAGTTAAASS